MFGSAFASRPHRGTNTVYHAYVTDPHLATRPLLPRLVEKHRAPMKETVPMETDVPLEHPMESSMSYCTRATDAAGDCVSFNTANEVNTPWYSTAQYCSCRTHIQYRYTV